MPILSMDNIKYWNTDTKKSYIEVEFEQIDLTSIIGSGTYGKVYKTSNQEIVCKIQFLDDTNDGISFIAIREIGALKRVISPYIVKCHKMEIKNKRIYTYMPRYNYNLTDYIHKISYSKNDIRHIMHSLVSAVYCMDQRSVLHRDIKPDNILINNINDVVIADFGLSKFISGDVEECTGYDVQTLWYRSPEVLLGETKYTSVIEMWSLGVIMCDLLSKFKLKIFHGDCAISQLYNIFKIFGTPNNKIWDGVEYLRDYKKTFPKWEIDNIDKYIKCDYYELDFLSRLFIMDPKKRLTPDIALLHPYFAHIHYIEPSDIINITFPQNIFDMKTQITTEERTILVDWLIDVTIHFVLKDITFFLAVSYLDIFLKHSLISNKKLQLLGSVCLFIASKIMEIYTKNIIEFVDIAGGSFSIYEFNLFEEVVLKNIEYNLYIDTEYSQLIKRDLDIPKYGEILKKLYSFAPYYEYRKYSFDELITLDIHDSTKYINYIKMHKKINKLLV